MLEVTVSANSELLYNLLSFFPTLGSTLFKILTTWTHPLKSSTSQPFSFSSLIASFVLLSQSHKNSIHLLALLKSFFVIGLLLSTISQFFLSEVTSKILDGRLASITNLEKCHRESVGALVESLWGH